MKQDDNNNQEISNNESEDTRESTLACDIEEEDVDHELVVQHLAKECLGKSLWTTMVAHPPTLSHATIVIVHPPLPNSWFQHEVMAPRLLNQWSSILLDKSFESDHVLFARALPLPKCSGAQNVLQPKANGDQNIPQCQMATFEGV